jgi:hypothetical protein
VSNQFKLRNAEVLQVKISSEIVKHNFQPFTLAAVYHPPGQTSSFIDEFHDFLEQQTLGCSMVILGDFNLHVDNPDGPGVKSFLECLTMHGWCQHVQSVTHDRGHTLDLVISRLNSELILPSSMKITEGVADHAAVSFAVNIKKPEPAAQTISCRSYKKIDVSSFWTDFWRIFLTSNPGVASSVDGLIGLYEQTATTVLDAHAPLKTLRLKKKFSAPWFDSSLKKMQREKRASEKKWKMTGLAIDYEIFKMKRNDYIVATRSRKSQHLRQQVKSAATPKLLWSILSHHTGASLKMARTRKSTLPTDTGLHGGLSTRFNDFFTSKIADINKNFLRVSPDALDSLSVVNTRHCSQEYTDGLALLKPVSPFEVDRTVRLLPRKKSPSDVLPLDLIRKDRQMVILLTEITNASFEEGCFPNSLKNAIVLPVLKKPNLDQESLANFRPISNLNIMSKLLERLAAARLTSHIVATSFLHPHQSAYRLKHSTETATLRVSSDWRRLLANGQFVCVISLDITAAFDTIDHARLLMKLYKAGVWGLALNWFESYLMHRSMTVKVGTSMSNKHFLSTGVPQGSVLGPLLFNIYMADLAWLLDEQKISFHIYADDVILYTGFNRENIDQAFCRLQEVLSIVTSWMWTNRLQLSPSKTSAHIFHSLRSILPNCPSLKLSGVELIPSSQPLKWLGVVFDPCLRMESFVSSICRSAYAQLRMIRYVRPSLDKATALLLCNALAISRLTYCNSLLATITNEQMNKIQKVMNLAARTVLRADRSKRSEQLLKELGWCSARKKCWLKVIRLTYLSLCGKAPTYLSCRVHIPGRNLRSSGSEEVSLEVVMASKRVEDGAWEVLAPTIWNTLPGKIRNLKTFSMSKVEEFYMSVSD